MSGKVTNKTISTSQIYSKSIQVGGVTNISTAYGKQRMLSDFGFYLIAPPGATYDSMQDSIKHLDFIAHNLYNNGHKDDYQLSWADFPEEVSRRVYENWETDLSYEDWLKVNKVETEMGV